MPCVAPNSERMLTKGWPRALVSSPTVIGLTDIVFYYYNYINYMDQKKFKPSKDLVFRELDPEQGEKEYLIYKLDPQAKEEILASNIDIRIPLGVSIGSFVLKYIDPTQTGFRSFMYMGSLCVGLIFMQESMSRELQTMRTVD